MRSRRTIAILMRLAVLGIAVLWTALGAPAEIARLGTGDRIAVLVLFALHVALLRTNVWFVSGSFRRGRRHEGGRLPLELPIDILLLSAYGGVTTAAAILLSYALAIPIEGRSSVARRLLDGGLEALAWLLVGVLRMRVMPGLDAYSIRAFAGFTAFYVACVFAYVMVLVDPARTFGDGIALMRLWRQHATDTRLWSSTLALAAWGWTSDQIFVRDGGLLAIAALAPLPFLAATLRAVYDYRFELHRLRLARDAVQAMLVARDPLPPMNSILASLHTPESHETLQIYATMHARDERFVPLASIGPAPGPEQIEFCRLALRELSQSERSTATLQTRTFVAMAYAVRSVDEMLLGALVVHRPPHTATLTPIRRFEQAAGELAPLLRDFRTIAVTQNAATVDGLTGLANRRAILEVLRDHIEAVTVGNPCAVLLLDIDYFKKINDELGHPTGDRCLRIIGATIAAGIRTHDRAGRIGGEEFVVMMPDTNGDTARVVGERLREAIQRADMRHANGRRVTASVGIAVAVASDTVDSLVARADRALYEAKRLGRNRVIELPA